VTEPSDGFERELLAQRMDRLRRDCGIHLRHERFAAAEAALAELEQLAPDSADLLELRGDILLAQGKNREARDCYDQAFKRDPTNVSAERKYATLVLNLSTVDRQRMLQQQALEDPSKRPRSTKAQLRATLWALVFPGLGQINNGDYTRGAVLFAGGALLLILLLYAVIAPFPEAIREYQASQPPIRNPRLRDEPAVPPSLQWELYTQKLAASPWYTWVGIVGGFLALLAIHGYSVWEAVTTAREEAAEADELGIEPPS